MNKSVSFFTKFMNISLKILLIPVLFICFSLLASYVINTSIPLSFSLLFFTVLCFAALLWSIKRGYKELAILSVIFIFGLAIRILFVLSINNKPVSDFGVIYNSAESVLQGNYSALRGSGYIARFPHMTMLTLYYSLIINFFAYPLTAIKVINAVFSSTTILLIYGIVKECFNDSKKSLFAALITAIFPPLIVYSAVYNSEIMAIPFYLASCYIFILVMNNKINKNWLLLSGLCLTIGHIFRMVGQVILVAFIMFILIYMKKNLIEKGKNVLLVLISYIIPLILVSNLLIATGFTEFQLWKGSEPFWTSVLRGTNIESNGRWNEEDSKIPEIYNYDYDKVAKASKEIIKQRLTTTPISVLAGFYLHKFAYQWRQGDFSASYWAQLKTDAKDITVDVEKHGATYYQLFFFALMLFTYVGLYNKTHYLKNTVINLFYIIFCGYGLFFLLIESQERYSFIVCWLFPILVFTPDWNLITARFSRKRIISNQVSGTNIKN